MQCQRSDQETRRATPSPDAVNIEERLLFHPKVLEPAQSRWDNGQIRAMLAAATRHLPHGAPHIEGHNIQPEERGHEGEVQDECWKTAEQSHKDKSRSTKGTVLFEFLQV